MAKFIVKRAITACLTVFAVAVITFLLMNAVPGNPWLAEKTPPPATIDALNAKYGLDRPLPVQLVKYLGSVFRGDLVSIKMMRNYPVHKIIAKMFPVSARIGALALLWSLPLGVALGCIAAYHRGKPADAAIRVVSTLGVATPEFVIGVLLVVLLTAGGLVPLFPGRFSGSDWMSHVLPCLTLGLYPMCYTARQMRASMLDTLGQDYIRTARAKGLGAGGVVLRHALRNALIPLYAYVGPMTAFVLSGSFVVEKIFAVPGLGRYFTQSVLNRDYPLIMGVTIFFAALLAAVNLAADILCRLADPRMAEQKGGRL